MRFSSIDMDNPAVRKMIRDFEALWRTKFAWLPVRTGPYSKVWLERYQIRTVVSDDDDRWFRCTHWRRELGDTDEGYPEHREEFRGGW
jgi:hypothetical protein